MAAERGCYSQSIAETSASRALKLQDLHRDPSPLAPHYRRFRVAERLLLTGHSHQAWPDCGLDGQLQAWQDAAELVDGKWQRAFEQAERVKRGFAELLDDRDGEYALASNTHELVVRLLSALPLGKRPRLVATDGEFHTIRRQLQRLQEEGLEVVWVPALPAEVLPERLIAAVDDRTAAVMVSSVLFQSGQRVPGLGQVLAAAARLGAELLVDSYHSLNVVPLSLPREGLEEAFVVGGGYKYCQLGEGCCFLRLPPGRRLRPVITGWFSEFSALALPAGDERVSYGQGGEAFAGATYDPTSHYRAARVFDFFRQQGLTQELLRTLNQHQVGLLATRFDRLDLPPRLLDYDRSLPLEQRGGFLALLSPRAAEICAALGQAGVACDSRDQVLRLGPAPYLSDRQLEEAMAILGRVARELPLR